MSKIHERRMDDLERSEGVGGESLPTCVYICAMGSPSPPEEWLAEQQAIADKTGFHFAIYQGENILTEAEAQGLAVMADDKLGPRILEALREAEREPPESGAAAMRNALEMAFAKAGVHITGAEVLARYGGDAE